MKRTAMNTLTVFLITVLMSTMAWAIDGEEQEHKLKMEAMGLQVPEAAPALEQEKSITIRATSKPYSGFQGVVVTPKAKQYPEGAEGIALDLLDNWDTMPLEDASKAQEKLSSLIREMSYEELKNIYEGYPNNSLIGNAMHQIWQTTMRSGENGFRVSRSSASEVEPNDDMSSANAMATDTVSAYITAYDEDWYSITLTTSGDWAIETHATTADDNIGDTKLYLYADTSSTNYVEYDDDGGSSSYSKITRRFEASDAGTYYVKVVGYSSSYAGAYLLTASSASLPAAYGSVVINEIHYNPATSQGSDNDYEFLELYNMSTSDVDLHGMTVGQVGSTTSIASLDSVTISAGSYVVVAYTGATYSSLTVPVVDNAGYFGLRNDGNALELIDSTGAVVDNVTYDDYYDWPRDPDGGGPSLELIDASSDNNLASSWRGHGISGGTPGAANSAQPDISMGSSITSYQTVSSTATATFQLNNNGDADLTVSSITVDSTYVAGSTVLSEDFETTAPTGWTFENENTSDAGFVRSSTYVHGGNYSFKHNDNNLSSAADSWMISPAITCGPSDELSLWYYQTGSSYYDYSGVWISTASNDPLTNTGDFAELQELAPLSGWTEYTVNLSAYSGQTVYIGIKYTGDYAHDLYIDDFAIAAAGANIVTTWLSGAVPSAAIAAGDSGDVSLTFNASSFTTDTTLTATVNVINNDPQDSSDTFTATMTVRADTAILDITSGAGAWAFGGAVVGDTSSGTASITIQNDGGANLVVDSLRLVDGTNWYTDLADSTVVEPNATSSFKVHFSPQAAGLHSDTLAFFINSDSTSGETVSMEGFGYTTNDSVYSSSAMSSWTNLYYSSSGFFTNYFTSSGQAYVVSPYMALGTDYDIIIRSANTDTTTAQYLMIYFSDDADATKWTSWTLLDSILVPAGTNSLTYYTADIGLTTADTGYVAIVKPVGGYYTYLNEVVLPKTVPEPVVASTTPEGYTLEGFDSGLPTGWTSNPYSSSWSAAGSGGYSGAYVKANVYGTSSNRKHFTTTEIGPISSGDSLVFAYSAREYNSSSAHEMGGGDSLAVSFTPSGGAKTVVWTIVDYNSADWAVVNVDLSDYNGLKGQFEFLAKRGQGDWDAGFDEVLYPDPAVASLSMASSLNFYGVAVDTVAGTGTYSLETTITNSGSDTLVGTTAARSADFTVSPLVVSLAPDSSMELTITYAPSVAELDTSYIDFTTNNGGGVNVVDSLEVLGYALVADTYDHFEFADYDESGFVRYNTGGGVYWNDNTSSSAINGSNSVKVSSHKYGGDTWLVTPAYAIDADGERLTWHMKTNDATPTTTSKLYIELLTGNTLADLANAVMLDSFVVSPTASDLTEEWLLYFVDAYNLTQGDDYYYGFHYEDEGSGSSYANGASIYIDNVYFADAPSVPILSLGSGFDAGVSFIDSGFVNTEVVLGQNTGGDTLFITSATSSDTNMIVTVVNDSIAPQGVIALNFSIADANLMMGAYASTITLAHNDTLFGDGSDDYTVNADFTYTFESFEGDYGVAPKGWKSIDGDGDESGWTFGSSTVSSDGDRATSSSKAISTPISDNWLVTPLYMVQDSSDRLIFDAHYSSASDPDYMKVMVSEDLGNAWVEIANESMMGVIDWARYEYDLSAYIGSDVRFAIVDINYGNNSGDKLWVDRFLFPNRTEIKPIAYYREMASDSTYMWDDSLAMVSGVVTVANQFGGPAFIQDSSGGVAVYASDFSNTVEVGDKVIVQGELTVYRGLLEITSTDMSYIIEGSGQMIEPEMVTLADLQDGQTAEALEGVLVKLTGLAWADTSDWNSGGGGFTLDATQGVDTFAVRIDNSTDINDLPFPPYGVLDLVGIVGQYHSSDAFGGFQLMPRSTEDMMLYAEYHGVATDATLGSALDAVVVTTDMGSDTTSANGNYTVLSSLLGNSISFSKEGYTPATFNVNSLNAGFTQFDVSLYSSPESVIYMNGLETTANAGFVDTSSSAVGTQWVIVDSIVTQTYISYGVYADTTIYPTGGSKMLAVTDSSINDDDGYIDNSFSTWFAPGVIDLAGFTGVNQRTLSMSIWSDTEANYDWVRVLAKSDRDTTDTWTILGSKSGNTFGWEDWVVDLSPIDTMSDARLAILFDSDGSIQRGFGALVDNIQIGGRDIFVAMAPSNLSASSFEDGVVNLDWSAPGAGGRTERQYIDMNDKVNFAEILREKQTAFGPQLTQEGLLALIKTENPRFTTNPKPYTQLVIEEPSTVNNSRALTHYNVFRKTSGGDFTLFDSTSSTNYGDNNVSNYNQFWYFVTAVYNEGESGQSNTTMGSPGVVTDMPLPLFSDFNMLNGQLPQDWSTENFGNNDWATGNAEAASSSLLAFPEHGEFAFINDDTEYSFDSRSALVTPFFSFTGEAEAVYLNFATFVKGSNFCDIVIRNNYEPWTLVERLSATGSEWDTLMVDLSEFIIGQNHVQVGFMYDDNGSWSYGWGIDDLKLGVLPGPTNLTADTNPGEIELHWLAPGMNPMAEIPSRTLDIDMINNISEEATMVGREACNTHMAATSYFWKTAPDTWYDGYSSLFQYPPGDMPLDSVKYISYSYENVPEVDTIAVEALVRVDSTDEFGVSVGVIFSGIVSTDDYEYGVLDLSGHTFHSTANNFIKVTVIPQTEVVDQNGEMQLAPYLLSDDGSTPTGLSGVDSAGVFFPQPYNFGIEVCGDAPTWALVYNVYRDSLPIGITTGTMFVDTDVSYGQDYCYKVSSTEDDSFVSAFSNTVCATPENQAPSAASLIMPADSDTIMVNKNEAGVFVDADNNTSLTFIWQAGVDPDGHDVTHSFVGGGEFDGLITFDTEATSYSITYADLVTAISDVGELVVSGSWAIGATDGMSGVVISDANTLVIDAGAALAIDESLIPEVFALHQNYPNPFNPVTNIQFDIPEESEVRMEIYNLMGQRVATLVNNTLEPGFHAVKWNGTNDFGKQLSSGMYIYRISANNFTSVKKLILMK